MQGMSFQRVKSLGQETKEEKRCSWGLEYIAVRERLEHMRRAPEKSKHDQNWTPAYYS